MTKLEEIAAILRGPGATCLMNERDSLDLAREVVEALREPSDAMIDAGDEAQVERVGPEMGFQVAMSAAVPWRTMIDAILKEAQDAGI